MSDQTVSAETMFRLADAIIGAADQLDISIVADTGELLVYAGHLDEFGAGGQPVWWTLTQTGPGRWVSTAWTDTGPHTISDPLTLGALLHAIGAGYLNPDDYPVDGEEVPGHG